MPLRQREVVALKADYPSLAVLALTPAFPEAFVAAVSVTITGIRGMHSKLPCSYQLIIETASLETTIPPVWVRYPRDADIKHVNIWHAGHAFCGWTGTDLPSFCWQGFGKQWRQTAPDWRTLAAALEYVKQFLNMENHDSAAR
jgi:hypothetical protein